MSYSPITLGYEKQDPIRDYPDPGVDYCQPRADAGQSEARPIIRPASRKEQGDGQPGSRQGWHDSLQPLVWLQAAYRERQGAFDGRYEVPDLLDHEDVHGGD